MEFLDGFRPIAPVERMKSMVRSVGDFAARHSMLPSESDLSLVEHRPTPPVVQPAPVPFEPAFNTSGR